MNKQVELNVIRSLWKEIAGKLEVAKHQIYEEIRNYPPPITACDEQFDQLLARRDQIRRELDRLRDLSEASLAHQDPAKLIDEFVASSGYLGDEVAQRIRASLKRAPSEPPT